MAEAQLLARLIRGWGELYTFWFAGGQYHAERRDNGARAHAPDAAALEIAIVEDYRAGPRPPGFIPPVNLPEY